MIERKSLCSRCLVQPTQWDFAQPRCILIPHDAFQYYLSSNETVYLLASILPRYELVSFGPAGILTLL